MLAKIVMQCEKNSDPTTFKIMQSELGISLVVERVISLMFVLFWISESGLWSCGMWCIVGVVVLHTNAP